MGIPGKGINISLAPRTKRPNKKQKARFAITDINNQDFRNFLKKIKKTPYLGYKRKQLHKEPTEA